MTELEARRILNEHKAECPSFVRRRHLYQVRRDGRVDVYSAVGKSGLRWRFEYTSEATDYAIPVDVRQRLTS